MIRIIVTGGTFDKQYDEIEGKLTFKESSLPQILQQVRCRIPYELEVNQLIDSLNMSEADRTKVLTACRRAPEKHLIITHGTDTMVATAQRLGEAALDKIIVLTGAMIPYSVRQSDALFNLGTALAAVQLLQTGVYIAMNGQILPWNNAEKDKEKGVFKKKDA